MKCKAKFQVPRIDLAAYRAKLKKHMTEEICYALSEWLKAVIEKTAVGEMPVWSGASRATFLKLARQIEYDIDIEPEVASRIQQGMDASVGTLDPNKKGDDRYTFTYTTTLPWLVTNENFNANLWPNFRLRKPGPYQFQLAGIDAFEELAKDVKLLPVATKVKSIRVG